MNESGIPIIIFLFQNYSDDEIIEVTPENIRIRKVELNSAQRKVLRRQSKSARK